MRQSMRTHTAHTGPTTEKNFTEKNVFGKMKFNWKIFLQEEIKKYTQKNHKEQYGEEQNEYSLWMQVVSEKEN